MGCSASIAVQTHGADEPLRPAEEYHVQVTAEGFQPAQLQLRESDTVQFCNCGNSTQHLQQVQAKASLSSVVKRGLGCSMGYLNWKGVPEN